jgi:nickel-dependent lactate racemase
MQKVELRTGVWYNDHTITLTFPDSWNVETYWPDTPLPLTDTEIAARINSPIGQPPFRDLAKGKKRPVVIVDDLARPTPVYRIMPFLLKEFAAAGIHARDIRILVATGTHGDQNRKALDNKIGKDSTESCRLIIHNDQKNTKYVGKTSFGTSVYINKEIVKSDFVIGIGGVYPQHSTGFGGGSKLALGILGRKSITQLHFKHKGVGGSYNIDNDFRRDVTEIARLIGMNTMYILHINAQLELISLMCGDHYAYYPKAAEFSKERYTAPLPDDADVVIANGYPSDISYTFMRKGMKAIRCAPQGATKIVVASNPEGIGKHGLFQQGISQRIRDYRFLYRKISVMEPRVIISKVIKNIFFRKKGPVAHMAERSSHQEKTENLWLYRPEGNAAPIPPLPGVRITGTWDEILKAIEQEHASKNKVRVRIYPCSSLQCLDSQIDEAGSTAD